MKGFTVSDILKVTKGKLIKGDPGTSVSTISTDSRSLKAGDLFFALIGERFDGHDFVRQALEQGAMGAVVSKNVSEPFGGNIIKVADTTQALGDVAKAYRSRFDIPVVGITGSNGKTTTKDMTAVILSRKYNVLKNEGNLNNTIGLPLTLFNLTKSHDIAILEMGISIPGEMSRLVEIARPSTAVVTNVSSTHLEFLGSIEGVAEEKSILAKAVRFVVLNADDPYVLKMRDPKHEKVILFGLKKSADVMAIDVSQNEDGKPIFTLVTGSAMDKKISVELPSIGGYNIYNALAAASVGILFDVKLSDIKEALESYQPMPMRMQKITVDGVTIISDVYNSNPVSLKGAIDSLIGMKCNGKKIMVIGDMLELGDQSDELHKMIGRYIAELNPADVFITVGNKASKLARSALGAGMTADKVVICKTNDDAADSLKNVLSEGDIALIKGSRGMKMEEIVSKLSVKKQEAGV